MLRRHPTDWLDPIPGLYRDASHRYHLGDHTYPVSVTGVLAVGKAAEAIRAIEATRSQWEPRGNTVHRALELACTDVDFHPDYWPDCWPWIDWVWPLLTHPLWNEVELIASEMGLAAVDGTMAGTFDGAFQTTNGARILFDLKTQARADAGAYCTRAQLGGYLTMALQHGIAFDGAATLWARPGKTVIQSFGVDECLDAWKAAWDAYRGLSRNGRPPLLVT
jgi:hypothetical protein